jgi:cupin fold WbuC family metalloprotein
MMRTRPINNEVYVAEDHVVQVGRDGMEMFQQMAARNARHRARLCTHKDNQNRIHEMLIALTGNAYIRPHRHVNKSESFHVIEGTAMVVFFDDTGKIEEFFEIGDYHSGKPFYYRNDSEKLVFHETTNGPFNRADTVLAPWSPEDTDAAAVKAYMENLKLEVARFR